MNVGGVFAANFVDAGHVTAAEPAFVNLISTICESFAGSVFVNARVVAPVIVIVHSEAVERSNVCVPDTEPRALTEKLYAGLCARPVNTGDAIGAYEPRAVATNAVVAICVVLVPAVAVGATGVPVNDGLFTGAYVPIELMTKAVVAICVVFVPTVAVGAVGTPVNAGDASGAYDATNAVVATFVELSPAVGVGAVGVPVNAGDAIGASPATDVAFAGVNPRAVVTSELVSVIAPVRVLNDRTSLDCAGIRDHAVPAKIAISPTAHVELPSRLVEPATLTL